jgi:hypothetical protein
MRLGILGMAMVLILVLGSGGLAGAVVLGPGDVLVGTQDSGSPGSERLILHVSAATGTTTQIARGAFDNVRGLAAETGGQIVVLDRSNFCGNACPARVVRVDPATGSVTGITEGGLLRFPAALTLGLDGAILVTDTGCCTGGPGVVRIDPSTGAQSVLAAGGLLQSVNDLAVGPGGDVFVIDSACRCVVRIDAASGAQTPVSTGGLIESVFPISIGIAADGTIFVACSSGCGGGQFDGAIIRIDPATGGQAPVISGASVPGPVDLAVTAQATLVVLDTGCCSLRGGVYLVAPATGALTPLFQGSATNRLFQNALSIAVVSGGSPGGGGAPGAIVELNQSSFAAGETIRVSGRLLAGGAEPVDVYIVLRMPDGSLLSAQLGGSVVPGVVPIARGLVPFAFVGELLTYTFGGSEARGAYTWLAATVRPGTLDAIGGIAETPFTFGGSTANAP